MAKYAPSESEISYAGQYPDMIEFAKPWESTIQVSQGAGKISNNGQTLQSEGFSRCFGVIMKNSKTLESALFHVDDIDMTYRQTPIVKELFVTHINASNINKEEKEELLVALEYINNYWCPPNMKREDFQKKMEKLNSDKIIQAKFILGDDSRDVKFRIVDSLFGFLGVDVKEDLRVETGRLHWDVIYKPNESEIYVNARNKKKVLKFSF